MKIEINTEEKSKKNYPYIGKHKGHSSLLVLFTMPGRGICLDPGDTSNKAGDYADFWSEIDFTYFYGTITLSND